MNVKHTALIYTSALKAEALSHANAIRFNVGTNKGQKRRERIAAHHGKMTRSIVIDPKNSEVTTNDGYISALNLCAATAGDAANAKAICLAHEVHQLNHYLTIGSHQHTNSLPQTQNSNISLPANTNDDDAPPTSSSSLATI